MTLRRFLYPLRDFISGRGLLSRILTQVIRYTEVTRGEVIADPFFTNLLFFCEYPEEPEDRSPAIASVRFP